MSAKVPVGGSFNDELDVLKRLRTGLQAGRPFVELLADEIEQIRGALSAVTRGSADAGLARDLDATVGDYLNWSRNQFPAATPESCLAHLRKEIEELAAAPCDKGEWAGIIFLAIHGLFRLGVTGPCGLAEILGRELEGLKQRRWQGPDAEGVYEHVREEAL